MNQDYEPGQSAFSAMRAIDHTKTLVGRRGWAVVFSFRFTRRAERLSMRWLRVTDANCLNCLRRIKLRFLWNLKEWRLNVAVQGV